MEWEREGKEVVGKVREGQDKEGGWSPSLFRPKLRPWLLRP